MLIYILFFVTLSVCRFFFREASSNEDKEASKKAKLQQMSFVVAEGEKEKRTKKAASDLL